MSSDELLSQADVEVLTGLSQPVIQSAIDAGILPSDQGRIRHCDLAALTPNLNIEANTGD